MNIISFDVGIKNLSFCILNLTNGIFNIKQWDVLSLCEEKQLCQEVVKNKKCQKEAKFTKNNECYCNLHAKNKSYIVPPKELTYSLLKKLKINELIVIANKYEIDCGTKCNKNMILEKIKNLLDDKYFEIIKPIKAENYDLVQLGVNMRNKLNKIINVDEINRIKKAYDLIEHKVF